MYIATGHLEVTEVMISIVITGGKLVVNSVTGFKYVKLFVQTSFWKLLTCTNECLLFDENC